MKLTPGLRAIMERLSRHSPVLELAVTASGGRAQAQVNVLVKAGYLRRIDHPTVKERPGDWPAEALEITDAGRAALAGEPQ